MPILADLVQVVIGVDTHKHTHTAAVVAAATGGVLATQTIPTTPVGYQALVALAGQYPQPRVWAVEGTGGYGAGLARLLTERGEWVVELDRPARPARRHGAKSDPIDAARAAREALGRPQLAQPRAGGQRAALGVLVTARRSAVAASTCAQRQLHALVVAAPSGYGRGLPATRPGSWSPPAHACAATQAGTWSAAPPQGRCGPWPAGCGPWTAKPAPTSRPSPPSCAPGGRTCSPSSGSARSRPRWCWAPGHIQAAAALRRPLPCWAGPHPSRPLAGRPSATGSTAPATASSTGRCTPSCWSAAGSTPQPAPT